MNRLAYLLLVASLVCLVVAAGLWFGLTDNADWLEDTPGWAALGAALWVGSQVARES